MTTEISPLHVRRAVWIDAPRARVWEEFTTFESMQAWYGTGHTLTEYEPRMGGVVETQVDIDGEVVRFRGEVVGFDPEVEVSFEQQWIGGQWKEPPVVTIRLADHDGGTLVELLHHGYERMGGSAAEHLDGFESGWTLRQLHALRDRLAH